MEHEVPEMNMIIIKRGHPHEEHPHGGAWKVAFADFMTAMMAFFLVLWIVNSTNKETRSSVARYFNPIRISDTTAARKGLKDPKEADFDAAAASAEEKPKTKSAPGNLAEGQSGPTAGNGGRASFDETAATTLTQGGVPDPITARDPFIVLDELAGRATGASAASGLAPSAEVDLLLDGPQPFRDPFAPPAPVLPPEAKMTVRQATVKSASTPAVKVARKEAQATAVEASDAAATAERAAAVAAAARSKGEQEAESKQQAAMQDAMAEASVLKEAISQALRETGLAQGPRLEVRAIDEGLLISLTDDMNFGMFGVGSAEPQPRIVVAMEKIGTILSKQSGTFVIRGHTDARAYKSRSYDNWRLSSARAQMAAYMLIRGSLDEKRIERVEGHADRALKNAGDPLAAENRRIEILLRRPK